MRLVNNLQVCSRGPRSAGSTDLWSAYVESHVAAGLNMEEEEEGEAKAEKGPTREVFLAHKNKPIKAKLWLVKRCHVASCRSGT